MGKNNNTKSSGTSRSSTKTKSASKETSKGKFGATPGKVNVGPKSVFFHGEGVAIEAKIKNPISKAHVRKNFGQRTSLVQIRRLEHAPKPGDEHAAEKIRMTAAAQQEGQTKLLEGGQAQKAGIKTKTQLLQRLQAAGIKDPAKQLDAGIKAEMEHTKDRRVAQRIAMDHLAEIPDYYSRLTKMEAVAAKAPTTQNMANILESTPAERHAALTLPGDQSRAQQLAKRADVTFTRMHKFVGSSASSPAVAERVAKVIDRVGAARSTWLEISHEPASRENTVKQGKAIKELTDALKTANGLERHVVHDELRWAKERLREVDTFIKHRRSSSDPSYRNIGITEYTRMEAERDALQQHLAKLQKGACVPRPDLAAVGQAGANDGSQKMQEWMKESAASKEHYTNLQRTKLINKYSALKKQADDAMVITASLKGTQVEESAKPVHERIIAALRSLDDVMLYKKPRSAFEKASMELKMAIGAAKVPQKLGHVEKRVVAAITRAKASHAQIDGKPWDEVIMKHWIRARDEKNTAEQAAKLEFLASTLENANHDMRLQERARKELDRIDSQAKKPGETPGKKATSRTGEQKPEDTIGRLKAVLQDKLADNINGILVDKSHRIAIGMESDIADKWEFIKDYKVISNIKIAVDKSDGDILVKVGETFLSKDYFDRVRLAMGPDSTIKADKEGGKPVAIVNKNGMVVVIAPDVPSEESKFTLIPADKFQKLEFATSTIKKEDLMRRLEFSRIDKGVTKEDMIGDIVNKGLMDEIIAENEDIITAKEKTLAKNAGKLIPIQKPGPIAPTKLDRFKEMVRDIASKKIVENEKESLLKPIAKNVRLTGQIAKLLEENTTLLVDHAVAQQRHAELSALLADIEMTKGGMDSDIAREVETKRDDEKRKVESIESSPGYKEQKQRFKKLVDDGGFEFDWEMRSRRLNEARVNGPDDFIRKFYLGDAAFADVKAAATTILLRKKRVDDKLSRIKHWRNGDDDMRMGVDKPVWNMAQERMKQIDDLDSRIRETLDQGDLKTGDALTNQYEHLIETTNADFDTYMKSKLSDARYRNTITQDYQHYIESCKKTIVEIDAEIIKERSTLDTKAHKEGTKAAELAAKRNEKINERIEDLQRKRGNEERDIKQKNARFGEVVIATLKQTGNEKKALEIEGRSHEIEQRIAKIKEEVDRFDLEPNGRYNRGQKEELYGNLNNARQELVDLLDNTVRSFKVESIQTDIAKPLEPVIAPKTHQEQRIAVMNALEKKADDAIATVKSWKGQPHMTDDIIRQHVQKIFGEKQEFSSTAAITGNNETEFSHLMEREGKNLEKAIKDVIEPHERHAKDVASSRDDRSIKIAEIDNEINGLVTRLGGSTMMDEAISAKIKGLSIQKENLERAMKKEAVSSAASPRPAPRVAME